jgi:hypothetical protein
VGLTLGIDLKPLEDAEPLCEAAAVGNIDRVKDLLADQNADPNACRCFSRFQRLLIPLMELILNSVVLILIHIEVKKTGLVNRGNHKLK